MVPSKHGVNDGFYSQKIDIENIRGFWPLVRPGIEKVLKKTSPSFIVEDVYNYLMQDIAWIIICFERSTKKYAGFVVVSRSNEDHFSTSSDMLLWLAYSEIQGAVESTLKRVEEMAKGMGFKCVIFHSSRKGWTRRAESLGFKIRERVYSKAL